MLIKILVFLLFVTFPLGQTVRWEFLGGQVTVRPNDLIALALGTIGWLKASGPLKKALVLWGAAVCVSLLANLFNYAPQQLVVAASYGVRFMAYAGLYFIFKDLKFSNKKILVYIALAIAILGFIQYLYVPDVRFLAQDNWDPHYYRLISTFLDPGFTGAILALGLLVTENIVFWVLIYLAFALTYSRASYVMFLVMYAVTAFYKKAPKIFLGAAILILATWIFLPRTAGEGTKLTRETSIWARIHNWQQSLQIFAAHPIFGVGYDAYRYVTNSTQDSHAGAGADSSVFLVLATTGLVGFVFYLNLLRSMWLINKSVVFRAGLAGVLVASFFNNTLFYPFALEWLWILMALKESS